MKIKMVILLFFFLYSLLFVTLRSFCVLFVFVAYTLLFMYYSVLALCYGVRVLFVYLTQPA